MAQQGILTIRVTTSDCLFPVRGARVTVEDAAGRLLALRSTDESGTAGPIAVDTPPMEHSYSPEAGDPCARLTLRVEHPRFERVLIRDVEVFPTIRSFQAVSLIPLPLEPGSPRSGRDA